MHQCALPAPTRRRCRKRQHAAVNECNNIAFSRGRYATLSLQRLFTRRSTYVQRGREQHCCCSSIVVSLPATLLPTRLSAALVMRQYRVILILLSIFMFLRLHKLAQSPNQYKKIALLFQQRNFTSDHVAQLFTSLFSLTLSLFSVFSHRSKVAQFSRAFQRQNYGQDLHYIVTERTFYLSTLLFSNALDRATLFSSCKVISLPFLYCNKVLNIKSLEKNQRLSKIDQ